MPDPRKKPTDLKQVEKHNMTVLDQAEVNKGRLKNAGWLYNSSNGTWRKPGGRSQVLNLGAADMGVDL